MIPPSLMNSLRGGLVILSREIEKKLPVWKQQFENWRKSNK